MGGVVSVACQGFLVREVCVGVLLAVAGFLLSVSEDNDLLFWVPDVLASIPKLFCGIYSVLKCSFDEFVREKVVSPSYSSAILGLPPT